MFPSLPCVPQRPWVPEGMAESQCLQPCLSGTRVEPPVGPPSPASPILPVTLLKTLGCKILVE